MFVFCLCFFLHVRLPRVLLVLSVLLVLIVLRLLFIIVLGVRVPRLCDVHRLLLRIVPSLALPFVLLLVLCVCYSSCVHSCSSP